jgi:sensor histidine kinase regulating citrate/malate metabolism
MQTLIIILIVVMVINEIIAIGVYFKSNLDKQQYLSLQETVKNTQADFIAQKQRYEKIIDEYKEIIRNMTYKCDKQDICINGYIKGTDTDGGVIGEKGEEGIV